MTALRTSTAVLGIVGAICLVLVQFMPWGGIEASGGGFSGESNAYTWKSESFGSGSVFGADFSSSDKTSWYSEKMEDDDGDVPSEVSQIRIAIPLLLAGLVVAAVGAVLGFVMRGGPAGVLLLVGGILAAIATIMFAMAVDSMYDSDQDWGASFYLAIAGSGLALLGGVLGMVPGAKSA